MSSAAGPLLPLAGAVAGGLAALAAREAVLATPAIAAWLRLAVEPLRRAGEEGYAPSTPERRRLAAVGAGAALLAGWFLAGAVVAAPLAVAGPALAGWAVSSRRRRFRRRVERALPEVAAAVADSLAAGRSLRASLPAAASSVEGPAAVELARLGAELELGAPTVDAVEGWRRRMRSPRVDAFAAALLSQRRAGRRPGRPAAPLRRRRGGARPGGRRREVGDRTGALHRPARRRDAERRRAVRRADPARLHAQGAERAGLGVLLSLAAALQLAGFVAIRRFARVVE